ncbi:MAG: hypothetical protein R6U98_25050 [Pirellulaceae bacterium]
MAKLIALEWDAREARVAVGGPRGNDVVVEEAFAIELTAGTPNAAPSTEEIEQQLAAELARRGLSGGDALVAVPRSSIELRTLSLPQAPPEELPDMVRFQAMQAFPSIAEDWPLDFIELGSQGESINVLAAVTSPEEVEKVQKICRASDLDARCLVLRPFAAVSLLHRYESIDVYRSSLIVDLLPGGADLTATCNGHVVFMRSVRLPSRDDVKAQSVALVGELRRTIGAAQNQMSGHRIEQVVVCGAQPEYTVLQRSISDALPLDVVGLDPFEAVRLSRQLQRNRPENSGRFAPLLGMLASEVSGAGHTIDFLNPRRRPKPASNKRRNLIIAAGAAAILAAGFMLFSSRKQGLDDEIARLTQQSTELDAAVEKAEKLVAKADRIKVFTDGDITWLDELSQVCSRLPDADHLMLREINLGPDRERGGRMLLKGNVVTSEIIADLEQALRYGDNVVEGRMGVVDRTNREYPYQLDTTIIVPPDVQENGHSLGRPHVVDKELTASDQARDHPESGERRSSTPVTAGLEEETVLGQERDATNAAPEQFDPMAEPGPAGEIGEIGVEPDTGTLDTEEPDVEETEVKTGRDAPEDETETVDEADGRQPGEARKLVPLSGGVFRLKRNAAPSVLPLIALAAAYISGGSIFPGGTLPDASRPPVGRTGGGENHPRPVYFRRLDSSGWNAARRKPSSRWSDWRRRKSSATGIFLLGYV